MDPAAWGIDECWWDTHGGRHDVSPASLEAISAAMGCTSGEAGPPAAPPLWFVRAGSSEPLLGPADLVLEDGTTLSAVDALPPDLPSGYHDLVPLDGGPTTRLVVSPGRCAEPERRAWGWAVQLYATRSGASWGIGDLGDLRRLEEWAVGRGAGVVAVNPLHAGGPALPQQASPYYPSTRRFASPLYLRVEEAPGATALAGALDSLAAAGRRLNERRLIDRDEVWRLKADALGLCFAHPTGRAHDPELEAWVRDGGPSLQRFATFCAVAEIHGNDWRAWPSELRRPDGGALAELASARADRVRFHLWLQWVLDRQLASATAPAPTVTDLPVGFDPGGFDAWEWQDAVALDARIGAPPDEFNTKGQDWGLPPFVPWRLRAAAYEPFVETLRASLRHGAGLRVDHVMGLFRLFWIPPDGRPTDGAYVRYRASELLDILAIESRRADAFVVGEDLGTVEADVRAELGRRGVLSYRLLWFESDPPASWPEASLAAVSTHDLPTIAGVWTGADLVSQREAGLEPNDDAEAEVRRRLVEVAGADEDDELADVTEAAYRALGRAPSRVVLATLDDALGVPERPNMPGTTDEWPNWSIALPLPLEDVEDHAGVVAVGKALDDGR